MHFILAFSPQRRIRLFSEIVLCRTRAEFVRTLAERRITGAPGRLLTWFRLHRFFDKMDLMKKMAMAGSLGALLAASDAKGASVVANVNQLTADTSITNYITNNDNAIYSSATFDFIGTYGNLLQAVKDNNPAYAGLGLNDIASTVGITIRSYPIGEVNDGWAPSAYDIATGKVTLKNNEYEGAYDVWNSNDSNNDMMALTFNFGNMLDFNDNNTIDANEALIQNGSLTNGFIGYDGGGYPGNTPMYQFAIPEPSTTGLLGLGLVGALLYRRREPTQDTKYE